MSVCFDSASRLFSLFGTTCPNMVNTHRPAVQRCFVVKQFPFSRARIMDGASTCGYPVSTHLSASRVRSEHNKPCLFSQFLRVTMDFRSFPFIPHVSAVSCRTLGSTWSSCDGFRRVSRCSQAIRVQLWSFLFYLCSFSFSFICYVFFFSFSLASVVRSRWNRFGTYFPFYLYNLV